MSKLCVVVLVGVPGAGKTTFCNELVKHNQFKFKIDIFSYDELCTDFTSASRKFVFKHIEKHIANNINSKDEVRIIIVDDNMYYKSMREEYYNVTKTYQVGFLQIYFNVNLDVAVQRNEERVIKKVPKDIIESMYKKMELPERNVYIIDSNQSYDDNLFIDIFNLIIVAANNPTPRLCLLSKPKETHEISKNQRLENLLRKIVHDKVSCDHTLALRCSFIKQILYKRIKSGSINIDDVSSDEDLEKFLLTFFDL